MKFTIPLPFHDDPNGLVAVFDRDTEHETQIAFMDVVAGQREYPLPEDSRRLVGIYLKIHTPLSTDNEAEPIA